MAQGRRWGGIPVHWGFLCRIGETKLRGAWSWGLCLDLMRIPAGKGGT